jgi:hypothetical protein
MKALTVQLQPLELGCTEKNLRSEVLIALTIHTAVLWVMTPCCSLVGRNQNLRGIYCLHVPPKCWYSLPDYHNMNSKICVCTDTKK